MADFDYGINRLLQDADRRVAVAEVSEDGTAVRVLRRSDGAILPVTVEFEEALGFVNVNRVKYDGKFVVGAVAVPSRMFLGWLARQVDEHLGRGEA